MKLIICLSILVTIASAQIDWSKVYSRNIENVHINPLYRYGYKPRIVGGVECPAHSRPYQVALFIEVDGGTAFCGGSLIGPTSVLTAAHCTDGAKSAKVVLGAHKVREDEDTQITITTKNFTIHPDWDRLTLTNDISIVHIDKVDLNDNIQLVELPSKSDVDNDFKGEAVVASGWGLVSDDATTISETLQQVDLEVISNLICSLAYLGIVQDGHICTSGKDGVGTCSGDSGGPLVLGTKQVGLVSFGISLGCEVGWPSVYTRITEQLEFIQKNSDAVIKN